MFLAIVLVTIGFAFLGLNLGFIDKETFSVLWPLLFVFYGVYVMMKGKSDGLNILRSGKKKK